MVISERFYAMFNIQKKIMRSTAEITKPWSTLVKILPSWIRKSVSQKNKNPKISNKLSMLSWLTTEHNQKIPQSISNQEIIYSATFLNRSTKIPSPHLSKNNYFQQENFQERFKKKKNNKEIQPNTKTKKRYQT